MSQRDHFAILSWDAAVLAAQAAGIIEIMPSLDVDRAWNIRLTERGQEAFQSLDTSSKNAMKK